MGWLVGGIFCSIFVHHVCLALRIRQGVRVPGGEQVVARLVDDVQHSNDGAGAGYVPPMMTSPIYFLCLKHTCMCMSSGSG